MLLLFSNQSFVCSLIHIGENESLSRTFLSKNKDNLDEREKIEKYSFEKRESEKSFVTITTQTNLAVRYTMLISGGFLNIV